MDRWSRKTAWILWHLSQVLEQGRSVQLEQRRIAQPRTAEGREQDIVREQCGKGKEMAQRPRGALGGFE